MSIHEKIALLTDAEAELTLHHILNGMVEQDPNKFGVIFGYPAKDMSAKLNAAFRPIKPELKIEGEVTPQKRPEVVRLILTEMANNEETHQRVEVAINRRKVLLEPVTTAVVLAGIVALLSTRINFKADNKGEGNKVNWEFELNKEPNTESILDKFFNMFK